MEGGPPWFPRDATCPAVLTVPCGASTPSPTGLSPSSVARSSGVRLAWRLLNSVAGRPPRPTTRTTPPRHRPVGHPVAAVWAPPRSLAATRGILSLPRGTEMFQFPRFPPHPLCVQGWVSGHHPAGVAPFGYPRIIACPRLPEAFRRLATSFFGPRRQGIHRVPILWISYLVPVRSAVVRPPTPGGFPPAAGSGTAEPTPPGVSPPARRPPARSPRGTPPPTTPPALTSSPSPVNVPRRPPPLSAPRVSARAHRRRAPSGWRRGRRPSPTGV